MDIKRMPNESAKQYKIRLSENKAALGLSWNDIANLVNEESGLTWSERYYRTWYPTYMEGYIDGQESSINDDDLLDEYEAKRIEYEKERKKLSDYRAAYNKDLRESAREEIFYEMLVDKISEIEPYKEYVRTDYISMCSPNDLFISLNDIHFGAFIRNHWNEYNSDIAKERFDRYLDSIFAIQKTHGARSCYVCANGDLISGNIHKTIQISNKENIVEQVAGVSELISYFLAELSKRFFKVTFACVGGNHSRIDKKKEAVKGERLDNLIPFYLKARLQNIHNINFINNDIDDTFNIVNIRGLNYLNVHGDLDNFNNVSKLLDMIDEKVYCIHFGHLHHNCTNSYQRYKLIMSGSFQGVDDFCIEHRMYSPAEQMVCICNDKGILCQYPVVVQ